MYKEMATHTPSSNVVKTTRNLFYDKVKDTTQISNVMLIDSGVSERSVFYNSANENTFPIVYYMNSTKNDLLQIFSEKFPNGFDRLSIIFHNPFDRHRFFLDEKMFFNDDDLIEGKTEFSENFAFLINFIKNNNVKHVDFLACNSLNYLNWKTFYEVLQLQTNCIVGASNNETGNLKVGADWIMENTKEDIQNTYFNSNIENYSLKLNPTSINATGDVQIKQTVNFGSLYYSVNGGTFTEITSYPVNIQNPSGENRNVKFITNIYINNPNVQFEATTSNITFDGLQSNNSRCMITFSGVIKYSGFFKSITPGANNVIVQNFNTQNGSSPSDLRDSAGWLCATNFGKLASGSLVQNCTNNCLIFCNVDPLGDDYGENLGGICGAYFGPGHIVNCSNTGDFVETSNYTGGICGANTGYNGFVLIKNCSNTGNIAGYGSGGICSIQAKAGIENCWNSGNITGNYSGGIAGTGFGYKTTGTAYFFNCYNIGNISGTKSGGITSNDIGYTNGINVTNINIFNCYNQGEIGSGCGGICGFADINNDNPNRNLTLRNCYSSGLMTNANSGLFGATSVIIGNNSGGFPISVDSSYAANNTWSDYDANNILQDGPTDLNNQADAWTNGTAWIKLAGGNIPYVISAFYSDIYNLPTDIITNKTYTSPQGLFQPGFTYKINNTSVLNGATVNINENTGVFTVANMVSSTTYTIDIFVAKYDDNGRPYSYNYNSYDVNTDVIVEEQPPTVLEQPPTVLEQPEQSQSNPQPQSINTSIYPQLNPYKNYAHSKVKGFGNSHGRSAGSSSRASKTIYNMIKKAQ